MFQVHSGVIRRVRHAGNWFQIRCWLNWFNLRWNWSDLHSAAPCFPPSASCRRSRNVSSDPPDRSSEPPGPAGGGDETKVNSGTRRRSPGGNMRVTTKNSRSHPGPTSVLQPSQNHNKDPAHVASERCSSAHSQSGGPSEDPGPEQDRNTSHY